MHISQYEIWNYKSFVDSGPIGLGQGFNVICGQNNSGKTAFLEGMDPSASSNPHRSLVTVPTERSRPDPVSRAALWFTLDRAALREILRERGDEPHFLAFPALNSDWRPANRGESDLVLFTERFLAQESFTFALRRDVANQQGLQLAANPSYSVYPVETNHYVQFRLRADGSVGGAAYVPNTTQVDLGLQLSSSFQERIYRFNAERLNVGLSAFGTAARLSSNAANLPEVLNVLQSNTPKFAYFNSLLHEVLPQIHQISVVPFGASQVEIRVWTTSPNERRLDLTQPLAQCGTGIGQVLSILYVALFSTSPQVVVVDEPQSFLHPGAIRKLIQVLKSHSKHQYIISTHSPTAIVAAEPTTIYICRITEGVSRLSRIDPKHASDVQSYLVEVGARLSDVFGADNVLWVEGRTEEICFPMILERIGKRRLKGTTLLGVSNTGDLQTRDAERIFDMYNRLTQQETLLPPAVAFVFDSECRTLVEKTDLRRRSRNILRFLPRRMYENYLLNSSAIAAVTNEIEGFRGHPVTPIEVDNLLEDMESRSQFACPSTADLAGRPWRVNTNGAKVLDEIFTRLSDTRVTFDKTKHSVRLTEWLINNAPEDLREVYDLIQECLPPEP